MNQPTINQALIDNFKANNKAYKYAKDVVNKKIISGKYIIKACQRFIDDIDNMTNPNFKFFLDFDQLKLIENLTKIINMATGLKCGIPSYEALAGFQWFFLINALCWKYKDKPEKRRYEKSVLLIARKSGKVYA